MCNIGPLDSCHSLVWRLLRGNLVMVDSYFSSPSGYRVQKTLKGRVSFEGIGVHSGVKSHVELIPAPPNHGIAFERVDLAQPSRVYAHYDAVVSTRMATSLGYADDPQVRIGTVEHLLAALYALGITNVLIRVAGPEIPGLDGSASPFIEPILDVGIDFQPFSNPVLKVLKPIKIYREGAICELLPRNRLRLTTSIDFAHPKVGSQTFALELTPKAFSDEISSARTFGFLRDQEFLRKNGLALGASLDNVLGFSDTEVLNSDGTRFPDECVRHKLLDAIGDLALSGCWIEGEMVSFRGGHSIHLALLKQLKENPAHWRVLPAEPLGNLAFLKHPDSATDHDRSASLSL